MLNTHKSLNPVLRPEIHSPQRTGMSAVSSRSPLPSRPDWLITSFQSVHSLPVNHPHSHVTVFPHSCCSLKGQTLPVCCSGVFQGPNTRAPPPPPTSFSEHCAGQALKGSHGLTGTHLCPGSSWLGDHTKGYWFCGICWACHHPSLATQEEGFQKPRHFEPGCPQWSGKLPISSLLSYETSYKPSEGRYQD